MGADSCGRYPDDDDDVLKKKLEHLVCTELESHMGNGDKVIAEFIIELGRSSENLEEFHAKLMENGAVMLDYLELTLLTIIHANLKYIDMDTSERDRGRGRYDEEADQEESAEEELEIELNQDEPVFLQGQTRYSMDKICKNPEGSLGRAAALQSALIKERREVREQQQRTMLDSIPKDLNRPWEDPMPETGQRLLAQELRGVGLSAYHMPEWKKDVYGKTITFGQRSKLSIQDQRQSLPIYKLKKELIQAVLDNQVAKHTLNKAGCPKERKYFFFFCQ